MSCREKKTDLVGAKIGVDQPLCTGVISSFVVVLFSQRSLRTQERVFCHQKVLSTAAIPNLLQLIRALPGTTPVSSAGRRGATRCSRAQQPCRHISMKFTQSGRSCQCLIATSTSTVATSAAWHSKPSRSCSSTRSTMLSERPPCAASASAASEPSRP